MARNYIKLARHDSNAIHVNLLLEYIRTCRRAYELGMQIKGIMDNNFTASPENYADLEAHFGIPAGLGDDVYTLVNGSVGSMTGQFQVADLKNLTERVG